MPIVHGTFPAARALLVRTHWTWIAALLLSCVPNKAQTTSDQKTSDAVSGATDSAAETSTGPETTTGVTENAGTTVEVSTDGSAASAASLETSIATWDPGGEPTPCETWDDTCPRGYKCNPYWPFSAAACFPVDPSPDGFGEPCQQLNPTDLNVLDSCEKGFTCSFVPDDELKCIPLCQGVPDSFTCPDHFTCFYFDPQVAVCHPICNPLASDCPESTICGAGHFFPQYFVCVQPITPEKNLFEACQWENECKEGLICQSQDVATECSSEYCCNSLCALDSPNNCPGVGQQCVPLIEPSAYPEYENLGYCRIP